MAKGKVQIDLVAKDEASAKIKGVAGHSDDLKKSFLAVAAAAVAMASAVTAAVGKMLDDWSSAGDEIAKMAKRTGWTVESLSELSYMAKLSGTDLNSLETASKKLARSIVDAGDGLATYTREFERLGLNVDDLLKMGVEDQFWTVALAIANLDDATLRTNAAVELFGRSGTDLLPILADGASGVQELRQRYAELGYQWSGETAAAAEQFRDAFEDINVAMDGVKLTLVEELGPEITRLINEHILPGIVSLREFIDENADLKQAFLDVAGAIMSVVNAVKELYGWYKAIQNAIPDWLKPMLEFYNLGDIMTGKNVLGSYQKYLGEVSNVYAPGRMTEMAAGAPGGYVPSGVGDINVTINGNVMGDEAMNRAIAQALEPYLGEAQRTTSFPHVNTSGYYPGSSAR
jgi:hypothetical protein